MRRDDENLFAHFRARHILTTQCGSRFLGDSIHQCAIQTVHPRVIELRSDRTKYRHLIHLGFKQFVIPLELLAHVAQSIQSTALIELIQRNHIGKIEHIDLFQLRRCAIFRGHYVQSHIAVLGNHRIALTNSAGLHHDQIIARHLQNAHCIVYVRTQRQVGLTGCHRTHIHTVVVDAIHANTVAQQSTARFSFRWVDGNDGQFFLREIRQEPTHQLIHQATFARTAGTCDTQNGGFDRLGLIAQIIQNRFVLIGVIFCRRNQSRDIQFGLYASI